jgi:hypothetical protein
MYKCSADDRAALQYCLHGLLIGAIQAMETAGRTVCDCTDEMPWECAMDMARQVWDKARHVDICMQLLAHVEGYSGEAPETIRLSPCAYAPTPEERVIGINRGSEGLADDGLVQLIALAKHIGDPVLERALDFVLADAHVRMRNTWLRALPADAPERLRKALECQPGLDGSGVLSMKGQPYAVV